MSCSPFKEAEIKFALVKRADLAHFVLHPDEKKLLSDRATPKRVEEFTLGRLAANQALAALGESASGPVLKGSNHEPIFPSGISGSIAHAEGVGIAAVAKMGKTLAVGVDLERPAENVSVQGIRRVATEMECKFILENRFELPYRFAQIFSGKEAIYKAYFSAFGKAIRNHQIEFEMTNMLLTPLLSDGLLPHDCSLTYSFRDYEGFIVSGVVIERRQTGI